MPDLIMQKDQTYSVKITEIQDGKKDIGSKHKYYIIGHDKNYNGFKAEYLCPNGSFFSPEDRDLAVASEFVIGIYRWVKCWQVSPNLGTPTIDPYDEQATGLKAAAALIGGLKNTGVGEQKPSGIPYMPNCYSVQITGSSICFATAWAKDILCSEIAGRESKEVTDEDIDRMMSWSHAINDKMCERINFDK